MMTNDERLSPHDISAIIDCPALPLDSLENKSILKSTFWKVSFDILSSLHPALDLERLRSVVKKSALPVGSIKAFIDSLHHKSPPKGFILSADVQLWCHVLSLWREVHLNYDHLLYEFCNEFLPQVSKEELCRGLIGAWSDSATHWSKEDDLIRAMLAVVKENHETYFTDQVALAHSFMSVRLLAAVLTFDASNYDPPSMYIPPPGLPSTRFVMSAVDVDDPASLLLHPSDFVLTTSNRPSKTCFVGNIFYMYLHWDWFRRLLDDSKSDVAKCRVASLPAWINITIAYSILQATHGCHLASLSTEDAKTLLQQGRQVFIVDSSFEPCHLFGALWERCHQKVFPEINDANRLECLALYDELGMMHKVDEVLGLLAQSKYPYDLVLSTKYFTAKTFKLLKEKIELRSADVQ